MTLRVRLDVHLVARLPVGAAPATAQPVLAGVGGAFLVLLRRLRSAGLVDDPPASGLQVVDERPRLGCWVSHAPVTQTECECLDSGVSVEVGSAHNSTSLAIIAIARAVTTARDSSTASHFSV